MTICYTATNHLFKGKCCLTDKLYLWNLQMWFQ